MLEWIRQLGRGGFGFFEKLGRGNLFLLKTLVGMPAVLARPRLLSAQLLSVGVLSFLIIAVSGLFVGMVLALQGYNTLVDFGAEESLGVVVSLSIVRELGPVVTALLFAGRAGSALTAEIGLMKATEQLSGMEMMAVDPVRRVLTPRFFAGFISMPLLAAMFSALGVLGGYFVGVGLLGIPVQHAVVVAVEARAVEQVEGVGDAVAVAAGQDGAGKEEAGQQDELVVRRYPQELLCIQAVLCREQADGQQDPEDDVAAGKQLELAAPR